ncbi:hypothetical protein Tco_1427320 [Tanacetum coccineum]
MVAYLEKSEGSEGFHEIIDFLSASHIHYALTASPTIYTSLIEQFWQTAALCTIDDGVLGITATIDRKVKITVSEGSIRRHLKFEDYEGIPSLPTAKIFEQLALIGYVTTFDSLTFQKGHFSSHWKFFIHTILYCLSPKKTAWEQFSSNIATTIICLATNRTFNFSKFIFDAMVKNLDSTHKFLMYPRFIQIFLNKHQRLLFPHTRTYPTPSLTHKLFRNMKRVSKGYSEVITPLFDTMLVQHQGEEPSIQTTPEIPPSKITFSPSLSSYHTSISAPSTSQPPITPTEEAALMPYESPLQNRIRVLEKDLQQTKKTYSTDLTRLILRVKKLEKNVKTGKARRRAKIVISEDEDAIEDSFKQGRKISNIGTDPTISLVQPQQDMGYDFDATASIHVTIAGLEINTTNIVVSTADAAITTASASINTVSPPRVSTVEDISGAETLVYIRRSASKAKDKGKAIMQESKPAKKIKKRVQVQMSVDEELAKKIDFETALELQKKLDEREEVAAKEAHDIDWSDPSMLRYHALQNRPFSVAEENGSEKKTKGRLKRVGQDVVEEPAKRQKTTKASELVQEQPSEELKADELSQEQLQQMILIVPEEGMHIEALQIKYPIIDWEVHSEDTMKFYKIIRVGNDTEVYQGFEDMLKNFDREDLEKPWSLVKERLNSRGLTDDKEKEL